MNVRVVGILVSIVIIAFMPLACNQKAKQPQTTPEPEAPLLSFGIEVSPQSQALKLVSINGEDVDGFSPEQVSLAPADFDLDFSTPIFTDAIVTGDGDALNGDGEMTVDFRLTALKALCHASFQVKLDSAQTSPTVIVNSGLPLPRYLDGNNATGFIDPASYSAAFPLQQQPRDFDGDMTLDTGETQGFTAIVGYENLAPATSFRFFVLLDAVTTIDGSGDCDASSVVIINDTVPDDGTDFTFDAPTLSPSTFVLDNDDDGDPTFPEIQRYPAPAGPHTITMTSNSNYASSVTCTDRDGGTTTDQNQATLDVDAGEAVTCTFKNDKQISFSKSFTDDPVLPGGQVTLEFSITNHSSSSVTSLSFTDNFTEMVGEPVILVTSLPAAPCGEALSSLTESAGGALITLEDGSVAAGASCTFSVQLDVEGVEGGQSYTNTTSVLTGRLNDNAITVPAASDDLEITELYDYGDAPDTTAGTGTGDYQTLLINDGPRHVPSEAEQPLFLGGAVDVEADGQPNATATGDDVSNDISEPDDEDGVVFTTSLAPGQEARVGVEVNVSVVKTAFLNAWIDYNQNGSFSDAGEQIITGELVASGVLPFTFTVPSDAMLGSTFARFRLSGDPNTGPTGLGGEGEVEDYRVTLIEFVFDYGDAPDSYGTLLASDGARHALSNSLLLGALVDHEGDATPTATADSDDAIETDDEDGVVFSTGLTPGQTATVELTSSGAGLLNAWIDQDNNGSFEVGEQIFTDEPLSAGANSLDYSVLPTAITGPTYARFRLSSAGGDGPTGAAADGEVEDYLVTINPAACGGSVIYVKEGSLGTTGTSWADAYPSLQDALTCASTGQSIFVAAGTYYPDEGEGQSDDDRASTFQLKSGVSMYGGFQGIASETDPSDADPASHPTILSGDLDKSGGLTNSDAYHVVTASSTDATAVLNGFTVTGGHANGSFPDNAGAGMYNSAGSPSIQNVRFESNTAASDGGAVYNESNASPTFTNVVFRANAASAGGAVSNGNATPTFINVLFNGNTATGDGGAVFNFSSSPVFINSTVVGNTAGDDGGGMANAFSSSVVIRNSIFYANTAVNAGASILNSSSTSAISHSGFDQGTLPGTDGENNILSLVDPFVNADGADDTFGTADDDLQLKDSAAAIDAGNNAVNSTTSDLAGNPRKVDDTGVTDVTGQTSPVIDIGAFEKQTDSSSP